MERSLLEYIATSRTDEGVLPSGFSLPEENPEEGVRFADGALDGITVYHMGHTPLSFSERQELGKLLDLAGSGSFNEAEEGFREFCKQHRAIAIIDDLQHYIADNTESLDADQIFEFAVHMLIESRYKECVKVGLSILEMFDTFENEVLARNIRIAGLSDEFTIFSVFCMRNWPDAETELLELAKRVRGWGRIHCIDFIEASAKETKDWLFYNGVDNDIVPAYSALTVYEKADVADRLKKDRLTYEEMSAILMITSALMDEGPVSGISALDDPKGYLSLVIEHAKENYPFTEEEKTILNNISI